MNAAFFRDFMRSRGVEAQRREGARTTSDGVHASSQTVMTEIKAGTSKQMFSRRKL